VIALKRRALVGLWVVAALLVVAFVLRSFVADVYRVESGSMEPTILGGEIWGEWVLVRYERPDVLERFELVVAYKGGGTPVVKRVVGLPGERVQVVGGDLFVGGKRLPPTTRRPAPIVLFDSRTHAIAELFEWDPDVWTDAGDEGWWLDTRDGRGASTDHLLAWLPHFDDGYLLPDGTRIAGTRRVTDGAVFCQVTPDGNQGTLRLELRDEGDLFRGEVELGDGTATARILRLFEHPAIGEDAVVTSEVLVESLLEPASSPPYALSFANVDNTLALAFGDAPPLVVTYGENRPPSGPPVARGTTVGTQVALGGDGVRARFDRIVIARDLHWVARGEHAVEQPISLGPAEYFLLGDNSVHSRDGREWGPTGADEILGRPRRVVWPRVSARSLSDRRWVLGAGAPLD
jgi:signal peptidase I